MDGVMEMREGFFEGFGSFSSGDLSAVVRLFLPLNGLTITLKTLLTFLLVGDPFSADSALEIDGAFFEDDLADLAGLKFSTKEHFRRAPAHSVQRSPRFCLVPRRQSLGFVKPAQRSHYGWVSGWRKDRER